MEQQHSQKIGNIPEIGFNKYKFLKSLSFTELTEEEKKQIEVYENKNFVDPEALQRKRTYIERVLAEPKTIEKTFTKKQLWDSFLINFKIVNGKDFEQNSDTLENLKVIMYYFLKSEEFYKCKNLTLETKPDLNKGLLIIGGYGTGKTSMMNTFEIMFKNFTGYRFKGYNANEVVKMFEGISGEGIDFDLNKKEFDRRTTLGNLYFDDVKTERVASNFGKVNLFREILEIRESKSYKTYISCNFKEGFEGDVAMAMEEFGEKYGSRVYDRLFSMFNVIIFNGKSFRK